MFRISAICLSLALVLSLLFNTITYSSESSLGECLICHEETYVKASSYSKIHTVVKNGCNKCHYQEIIEDMSKKMASTIFRQDIIFLLGDLIEEDKKYLIRVDALDTDKNIARPMMINTASEEVLNYPEESYELTEISDIRTEKVERKIFAKAVISWTTSVPTASMVEYGTTEKERNVLTSNNVYSREHRAVLTGLKHKTEYSFRITSQDMNGMTLLSEEQTFDTTNAFDLTNEKVDTEADPDLEPEFVDAVLMNIGKRKNIFISISSNEPVEFKVSITEIEKGEDKSKPCANFIQTQTSTIMVCNECHAHSSSHPVGIRPKSQSTRTPEELPTIEEGLITCVTCHFAHGGETDYFLRTKVTKDLCVKCHRQYSEQ